MADLTPEAVARAERTVKAAPVFADNAEVIAAQTPDLPLEHVLVAVVDTDYRFTGTHVAREMVAIASKRIEMIHRLRAKQN